MTNLLPIRRQVVVAGTPAAAFEVFTAEIGLWWPLDEHSVYGEGTAVGFEGGRLIERGPDGDESVWGTVLSWLPERHVRLTWHPGSDPAKASEVEVRFDPVSDGQTLVTVEHRGWERFADPAAARAEYDHGWPRVLRAYAASARVDQRSDEGPVWLALMHTGGPALPAGEPVFSQPDFSEHIAFLQRIRQRGVLIAAGSLDHRVTGMAVLRVPYPADVAEYVELAQTDDLSVVRGLLQVRVQPWHVALEG